MRKYWDGHVDADLAGLDLGLELARGAPGLREDGGSVAPGVLVDEVDGRLQVWLVHDDQDRAEDLLLVDGVVALHVGDDGGADEVALAVLGVLVGSPVEYDLGAFSLGGPDELVDSVFQFWVADGAQVDAFLASGSELERLGLFGQLW